MAKKKAAKKKKGAEKPKKKRVTITSLVLAYLDKSPNAECKAIYDHIVANGFPGTKFNKSHLAWYKYQVRKGNLKLPSGRQLPPARKGKKKADAPAKKKKVKGKGKKN